MLKKLRDAAANEIKKHAPEVWGRHDNGARTEFWRDLSWMVGDEHADRICRMLDVYSVVFKIPKANARIRPESIRWYSQSWRA